MTLEQLAKDISATAEAEAKATIKAAEAEAKTILAEAKARAESIEGDASGKADKEADQLAREMVASARQANQRNPRRPQSGARCYISNCFLYVG